MPHGPIQDNRLPSEAAIQVTLKARGISQAEICRRTGVSRRELGKYLEGRCDMPAGPTDRVRIALGLIYIDPLDQEE